MLSSLQKLVADAVLLFSRVDHPASILSSCKVIENEGHCAETDTNGAIPLGT